MVSSSYIPHLPSPLCEWKTSQVSSPSEKSSSFLHHLEFLPKPPATLSCSPTTSPKPLEPLKGRAGPAQKIKSAFPMVEKGNEQTRGVKAQDRYGRSEAEPDRLLRRRGAELCNARHPPRSQAQPKSKLCAASYPLHPSRFIYLQGKEIIDCNPQVKS